MHKVHPPFSFGVGTVEPSTKFSKRGALTGGGQHFQGVAVFTKKNKLKFEIFNGKTFITENLTGKF